MIKTFREKLLRLVAESLLVTSIANVIFFIIDHFLFVPSILEFKAEMIITMIAFTFPIVFALIIFISERKTTAIVAEFNIPLRLNARVPLKEFASKAFSEIVDTISALRNPEGAYLERDKVDIMLELCFKYGGENYASTTNVIPSQFVSLCDNYLKQKLAQVP